MSSIPGTEYLSGALNVISQSLTIPVMVLLLIIAVVSVIALGGFISEYTSMKKVGVGKIRDLIFKINTAASVDDLMNVISGSDIPKSQKKVLTEIAKSEALDSDSREALARKLVEHEEEKIMLMTKVPHPILELLNAGVEIKEIQILLPVSDQH